MCLWSMSIVIFTCVVGRLWEVFLLHVFFRVFFVFGFDLYGFSNVRAESQVVAAWVAVSVLGGFSMAVFILLF